MKTTIEIPESELAELIRNTDSKTKKDAVITAVRDYNKRHKMARLSRILGTFDDFMTQDELTHMRNES